MHDSKDPWSLLDSKGKEFCSKHWDTISAEWAKENPDDLAKYCFSSVYLNTVLQRGFGLAQPHSHAHIRSKINGAKIDWALGAVLYELMLEPSSPVQTAPILPPPGAEAEGEGEEGADVSVLREEISPENAVVVVAAAPHSRPSAALPADSDMDAHGADLSAAAAKAEADAEIAQVKALSDAIDAAASQQRRTAATATATAATATKPPLSLTDAPAGPAPLPASPTPAQRSDAAHSPPSTASADPFVTPKPHTADSPPAAAAPLPATAGSTTSLLDPPISFSPSPHSEEAPLPVHSSLDFDNHTQYAHAQRPLVHHSNSGGTISSSQQGLDAQDNEAMLFAGVLLLTGFLAYAFLAVKNRNPLFVLHMGSRSPGTRTSFRRSDIYLDEIKFAE